MHKLVDDLMYMLISYSWNADL